MRRLLRPDGDRRYRKAAYREMEDEIYRVDKEPSQRQLAAARRVKGWVWAKGGVVVSGYDLPHGLVELVLGGASVASSSWTSLAVALEAGRLDHLDPGRYGCSLVGFVYVVRDIA